MKGFGSAVALGRSGLLQQRSRARYHHNCVVGAGGGFRQEESSCPAFLKIQPDIKPSPYGHRLTKRATKAYWFLTGDTLGINVFHCDPISA